MHAQALGTAALIVLIGILQWVMPSLTQRTVPFGVRIPAERSGEPLLARLRGRYRLGIVLVTLAALAAGLLAGAGPVGIEVGLLVEIGGALAVYQVVRSELRAAKAEGQWFAGLKQVTVVDTTLRTAPERYPWRGELPSLLVVAGTLITGIVAYSSLPDRLVTRFDFGGHATDFADKSVAAAFALPVTQLLVTVLLLALTRTLPRTRAQLDAEDAQAAARHRQFVRAMTRGMLVLTFGVAVGFGFSALMRWDLIHPPAATRTALVALPALLATLFLVGVALQAGQNGQRLRAADPGAPEAGAARDRVANRDDDRFYRLGVVYFNREDPAVFVPKRFGIGWTVNFARPLSWLVLAIPAAIAIVGILLR